MGSPQQFILDFEMKWTLCLFFVASVATAMPQNKKGKAFSLFSVVTFPYVDVNTAGGAMAATININTDNNAGNRFWKILVQRIACNSPDLPPAGCLQFFTGLSGLITSFNGARMADAHQMIQNQQYRVCIKRGAGMCSVRYREAAGQIDSFGLGAAAADAANP